jgi:hypothetical protein
MNAEILTKAARNAADFLGIDLDRLYDAYGHSVSGKEEVEMILVRDIYKPLFSIMDGHKAEMRNWMKSDNSHLQGVPKDLVMSYGGLMDIAIYLQHFTSKLSPKF